MCIWAQNYSTHMNTGKSDTKEQQLVLRIPLYSRHRSVFTHFYVTHNKFNEKNCLRILCPDSSHTRRNHTYQQDTKICCHTVHYSTVSQTFLKIYNLYWIFVIFFILQNSLFQTGQQIKHYNQTPKPHSYACPYICSTSAVLSAGLNHRREVCH